MMTNILALDTATDHCSVALYHGQSITFQEHASGREHTEKLLPMVDSLLEDAKLTLDDIDYLALSIGPGSFTGLRISLSIVQGLAYAKDIPVIGVDTLAVMALEFHRKVPDSQCIVAALDARMGDIVWAVMRIVDGVVVYDQTPKLSTIEDATQFLMELDQPFSLIGQGAALLTESLPACQIKEPELCAHARSVVSVALSHLDQAKPAIEWAPQYFRAEIGWQKRQFIRQTRD